MIYLTDKQRKIISAVLEIGSWFVFVGIALLFLNIIFKWGSLGLAIILFMMGVIIKMAKRMIVREY